MSELHDHKTPANSREEIQRVQNEFAARWENGAGLRLLISSTISTTSPKNTHCPGLGRQYLRLETVKSGRFFEEARAGHL